MQPGCPLLGRRRCDCGGCTPWSIMPQLEATYYNVDGTSLSSTCHDPIPRQCHPLPEPLQELSTLFLCFHSSPLQTLFHRASGVMVSKRKPDNKAGHGYFC